MTILLRVIAPLVRVPVLSNTTVETARVRSKISAFLNRIPSSAPRPEPTMMAVGVARPRAHGQAMMSTATDACTASGTLPLTSNHPVSVPMAMSTTTGTNTPEMRSASRWIGALLVWASSTNRTIWARAVSEPMRVAATMIIPCWLMVAPNTSSPGALSTGLDSPDSMLSSNEDDPSSNTPSVGTFSPGRITMWSPGAT